MKKKILVVDDEKDLREILMESIESRGYSVLGATNGIEALKILENFSADAVVSDVNSSEVDGSEFVKNLAKVDNMPPLVLLMSGPSTITTEEAYDLGVVAILEKPFPLSALFDVLERIFENQSDIWKKRPPRHSDSSEIEIRFEGFESAQKASLFNIGRGGIYIQSTERLPKIDSQVHFKIQFGPADSLTLSGIGLVRWIRTDNIQELPKGFGLEFIFLDEPGRSKLKDLLRNMSKRAYIPLR